MHDRNILGLITCLIYFVCSFVLQAQSFSPVVPSDFFEKALSNDVDYDALVLERKQATFFSPDGMEFTNNTRVRERILITTEAGLKYATKQIRTYIKGETNEKVTDITGATYNLVDGEVIKTDLDPSGVFNEVKNEYFGVTKFTMPAVRVGSIIEFSYKKVSPYPSIEDIDIQYDIPINELKITVRLSRSIVYSVIFNPEGTYDLRFDRAIKEEYLKNLNDFDISVVDDKTSDLLDANEILTAKDKTVSIVSTAIPALLDEPLTINRDRYRAKLIFEIAAIYNSYGDYKYYSETWDDVASSISREDRFGGQLGASNFFKRDLEEAIASPKDDMDKAYQILKFLQSKVTWNGYYGKFVNDGLKQAYRQGSGNVAEINLLLTNMLEESGFTAYPVLVSSIDRPTPLFPTQKGFNYVICQVQIGGKKYLVDATEPFTYFNVLPVRATHWKGRVIKSKKSSQWVDLNANYVSEKEIAITASLDQDQVINYDAREELTHFEAYDVRNKYSPGRSKNMVNYIVDNVAGLKVMEITTTAMENIDEPLAMEYTGVYNNGVNQIGEKLYVNPLIFHKSVENSFNSEKRTYPLDLIHPKDVTATATLKLPDDYEVQSLPENLELTYDDDSGSYTFLIEQVGDALISKSIFKMRAVKVYPDEYKAFRNFMLSILSKESEKIVLKKIE